MEHVANFAALASAFLVKPLLAVAGVPVTPATLLAAVGGLVVLLRVLGALAALSDRFLCPLVRRKYWRKGDWAVVTGATDGIGKAYAFELAKRGLNVLLVSRTQSKLDEVAEEIRAANSTRGVAIQTVKADFANTDIYPEIAKALEGKTVSLLINNVGVSYPGAMFFDELPAHLRMDMIHTNLTSVVEMSALVLKGMRERRRGAIVNISSASGRIPVGDPLYALYSGTKAAVDQFSRALNAELAGSGVHVQSQLPYLVVSKMSKVRRPDFFTPTPKGYAVAGMAAIGGSATVVPYWTHAIIDGVVNSLPHWLLRSVCLSRNRDLRKRYFRKLEREAAEKAGTPSSTAGGSKKGASSKKD